MRDQVDIAIVGGGPVGCACAALLARSGIDALVLEARSQPVSDPRALAIAYSSARALAGLGAWDEPSATPIEQVHVSEAGRFGSTTLDAATAGLPALGYTVRYASLARALQDAAGTALQRGVQVTGVEPGGATARLALRTASGDGTLQARLVIVADGNGHWPGIERYVKPYAHAALMVDIRFAGAAEGWAWERFTAEGPLALLPRRADDGALAHTLIWSIPRARAESLVTLDDAALAGRVADALGSRLPRIERIESRAMRELTLAVAHPRVAPRLAVIGNAAQTLHPIAGQGFNLGLRDAIELAAVLADAPRAVLGDIAMLQQFALRRRSDRLGGLAYTDGLIRIAALGASPVRTLRGLGLALLDILPGARRRLLAHSIFGLPA